MVNAWETELKQHFLFFVTGSRRLPQPQTEVLRIELPFVAFDQKDHMAMLSRLPQVRHLLYCCNSLVSMTTVYFFCIIVVCVMQPMHEHGW